MMRDENESREETYDGVSEGCQEMSLLLLCLWDCIAYQMTGGLSLWQVVGVSQPPNLAFLTPTCSGKGKVEEVVVRGVQP